MAIVPVSKITLYGIADQKEAILEGLQDLGCTHLVNLTPGSGDGHPVPAYSVEAHEALKYLETCPTQRRPKTDRNGFDFAAVQRETLEIKQRERELNDERDDVVSAIEAVRPWGDFRAPPPEETGGLRFWFYVVPHRRMDEVRASGLVWQAVARDERFNYVVVIQADKPENMPVAPEELGPHSLSQLKRRSREIEQELDKLHSRREELTRQTLLFKQTMREADDRAMLEHAGRQTLDESRVFAVQGWAPRKEVPRVESFAKEHGLAVFVEGPGPKDEPPTLLTNPEPLAGGEATVTFYMTPAYHTWDPSIVVFFSFAIFFGMIFSDAGYGLLLGAVLLFWWRNLGKNRTGVRMRNLFLALVLASVGYGVLVGSYFGVKPPEGSIGGHLHILDATNTNQMMLLSIVVGAFHIVLANVVTAWRLRGSMTFLAPVGWTAMIAGGLIAGTKGDFQDPVGMTLIVAGAVAVLVFTSSRPLSLRPLDVVWRVLDGLKNLANVSRAFGDVLSYLRLFALGLASTQLAVTFNEIAAPMFESRGIYLLAAIAILLVGHGLNFVLAVVGGVVHGLRLNCIEFFNWSLPEEGYPFQPFCRKAN
jgi:V/A-type H+-transporting ATPase subunit I